MDRVGTGSSEPAAIFALPFIGLQDSVLLILRWPILLGLAVLGFAGSGFAYLLYYRLLSQVSATHVTAVTYLLPLWGLFWGLFAHESIGLLTCLGVAITIAGLLLLNLKPRAERHRIGIDGSRFCTTWIAMYMAAPPARSTAHSIEASTIFWLAKMRRRV